jgi:hypothetical protein
MRESVDRRVLGAFRCVDNVTGKSVVSPLAVAALPLSVRPNRSGIYVIFRAPGLDALTNQFDPTPPGPAAVSFEISVQDPSRQYLPRRARVQAPQKLPPAIDPSQPFDPAKVLSDPLVVFNPQRVPLYPSPAAPLSPNWAVIHISVISSGVVPLAGLPWAVVQVARTDNNTVLATTVTDARGLGLLAIAGLGPEVSGSDTGSVTQATVGITLKGWFDPSVQQQPNTWIPNPDDILNNLGSASLKTGTLTMQIGPGQTLNRNLAISV